VFPFVLAAVLWCFGSATVVDKCTFYLGMLHAEKKNTTPMPKITPHDFLLMQF